MLPFPSTKSASDMLLVHSQTTHATTRDGSEVCGHEESVIHCKQEAECQREAMKHPEDYCHRESKTSAMFRDRPVSD